MRSGIEGIAPRRYQVQETTGHKSDNRAGISDRPCRPASPIDDRFEGLRTLGGAGSRAALPRRTPKQFIGQPRYIPHPGLIRYEDAECGAQVVIKLQEHGTAPDEIVVTHLMRGALPRGSGVQMLAKVIRDHDVLMSATRLVFRNVKHDTTKAMYERNGEAANTALARVGQRVAQALGKYTAGIRFEHRSPDDGELDDASAPGHSKESRTEEIDTQKGVLCLVLELTAPHGTGSHAGGDVEDKPQSQVAWARFEAEKA